LELPDVYLLFTLDSKFRVRTADARDQSLNGSSIGA